MSVYETRRLIADCIYDDLTAQLERVHAAVQNMTLTWNKLATTAAVFEDQMLDVDSAINTCGLELHILKRTFWRMSRVMALLECTRFEVPPLGEYRTPDGRYVDIISSFLSDYVALKTRLVEARYTDRLYALKGAVK